MMRSKLAKSALSRLFAGKKLATLMDLKHALRTKSTMSVFRHLKPMGYLTSFTHRGRYYTLETTPEFDANGLWICDGVGFSAHGTLRNTLVHLVDASQAGMRARELAKLTGVRVFDALVQLTRDERIHRKQLAGAYVYLSSRADRAVGQLIRARHLQKVDSHASTQSASRTLWIFAEILKHQSSENPLDVRALAGALGVDVCELSDLLREHGICIRTEADNV